MFALVLASLLAVHAIDVLTPWGTVAAQVVLLVALAAVIWIWSHRVGWQQRPVPALALGVFAAYAVRALTQLTSISVETVVDGVGDILLDAAMVWLAVVDIRRVLAGSAATLRNRPGGGT